jgi:hypothetical protein
MGEKETESEGWYDPFALAHHREPLGSRAGVDVLALGRESGKAGSELTKLLRGQGRPVAVAARESAWISGSEFMAWLDGGRNPLVVVSRSRGPWRKEHLEPLLRAMDTTDHVVGRRRMGVWKGLGRWFVSWPVRLRFAIPARDLGSPCWLHRREAVGKLQLEAAGPGLGVEILAKATYLGQLVDEVEIPNLEGEAVDWRGDCGWARRPLIVRAGGGLEIRST